MSCLLYVTESQQCLVSPHKGKICWGGGWRGGAHCRARSNGFLGWEGGGTHTLEVCLVRNGTESPFDCITYTGDIIQPFPKVSGRVAELI